MKPNTQLKTKPDFIAEVERLNKIIEALELEIEQLKGVHKIKNERNAGRKTIVDDEMTYKIDHYRLKGLSYREIADTLGVSVGLVHKVYNRSI